MTLAEIPLLTLIVWWFIQIILHEMGHYLVYRACGVKPKLKIKWWGVLIGETEDFFRMSPRQWWLAAVAGPAVSVIYWSLTFPGEKGLLALILVASIIDISHMFVVVINWKEIGYKSPTYGHMMRTISLNDYNELSDLMEKVYEGRTQEDGKEEVKKNV